jgi:hypothetical protein
MTTIEKIKEKTSAVKMRLTVVLTALLALLSFAAPVSAGPVINGTILELLSAFAGLMPTFLNLIVAVAPVIITVAVIAFIVMFIDRILGMLKLG